MATDLFNYIRRQSSVTHVGNTPMGGNNPIRVQSMTTTSTTNTDDSVAQIIRIIEAGGEYIRLTTQGIREAENLRAIREELIRKGYTTPLVADVHFNPNVADMAALYAQKVRINPGNYMDPARIFKHIEYTDEKYAAELQRLEERFVPFLNICKEHNTAVRIGVNHGSLSDRIMSRYGDTPEGIVESCMEFLRICKQQQFSNVVISIKASNTVVMVRSVRLLISKMDKADMHYPLHLGVTEAGEGEDGRIKSAVGIGALLYDGIGDTIRVSLSEEPEAEIPVARHLVNYVSRRKGMRHIDALPYDGFNYVCPERRHTITPVVVADAPSSGSLQPDYIYDGSEIPGFIVVSSPSNDIGELRAQIHSNIRNGIDKPVIIQLTYSHTLDEKGDFQLEAAADMGALMFDGLADGIWLRNEGTIDPTTIVDTAYGILQAARLRTTKTEYISCPGCGRTLYDLRTTIARIKEATKDMTGLKIGIMGCIVNGPGEMADADYGYVGAGRGKISLYRRKECVAKNIPENEAVDRLLQLIHSDNAV